MMTIVMMKMMLVIITIIYNSYNKVIDYDDTHNNADTLYSKKH